MDKKFGNYSCLEICFDCKQELIDEYLLECGDIVLFVEHEHCFLVVNGIDRTERDGAIAICYKDGIACYACCSFVAIGECLNIREEHQSEDSFLKYIFLPID